MSDYFAHETAVIDEGAVIGHGTKIWHFAHICGGAEIGESCVFGQNTMVAPGVRVGSNVKVQNNVAIYTGTEVEDDVFLGPSCVLTNVTNPRSQVKRHSLYEKTIVRRGATIGANATLICGITIGRYAFIGAGSVVAADVPDYGLMLGVPGRLKGWMSRHGHKLEFRTATPDEIEDYGLTQGEKLGECPESRFRYALNEALENRGRVRCLDLAEDEPLPSELSEGLKSYDEFKK